MVRLRSNRWYAADGQRNRQRVAAGRSSGTRRVVSLCILLALVILLMQRASDPQHVRNAFQSLGVPLDPVAEPDAVAAGESAELPLGSLTTRESSDGSSSSANASGQRSGIWQENRRGASGHIGPPNTSGTWQATCDDVIPRILDSLTAAQQHSLAEFWFGRSTAHVGGDSPPPASSTEPVVASTTDSNADADKKNLADEWAEQGSMVIETLAEQTRQSSLSSDEKEKWLVQLQEFASQWRVLCTTPAAEELPTAVSPELQQALTTTLDQRLVADLRDAAPWTQSESLAFWRLLQRTTALRTSGSSLSAVAPSEAPQSEAPQSDAIQSEAPQVNAPQPVAITPLVSMLQLDAESRALRGRSVRFRGSVRRVERVERTYAPLHMQSGYWVLWLRGADDAPQPVAVYTTDPLAGQLVAQIDDRDVDYPHVEVRGIFGKRVAYASPAGLQVGPALFASQLVLLRSATPPLPEVTPQELFSQFRLAVVVACLLAAAVVLPILWRNRRQSKDNQPKDNRPGDRGSRRWWLLLLSSTIWPGLIASGPHVASAAPPAIGVKTQPTSAPPWATTKLEPLREFLQAAGVTPLSPDGADTVRASLSDRSSAFPDALLKAIDAIRRVGWADEPQTLEPIDLGGGLALHGRTISGWVRAATPVALDDTQRAWFQTGEKTQLYQVELQMQVSGPDTEALADPSSGLLTIYCERVPQMWLATARLRQPARFSALALVDSEATDKPALCALAAAPQWTFLGIVPTDMPVSELSSRLAPPLPPYLLQLGQLGWNLSYLDTIEERSQQSLSRAEAAGFYSMLRLSRDAPSAMASPSSVASDVKQADGVDAVAAQAMALLVDARESIGKPLQWRVRIVTGTLVQVTNADDQRELGGQAYIQYDGFVDIGNNRIRFQPAELPSGGAQPASPVQAPPLEFSGEYPVTIVAPQGDAWMLGEPTTAGQESWPVGQYAILQGRFYRLWSYQSELVKSHSAQARQIAPLVVATRLSPTTPPKRDTPVNVGWFGWAMSAAMIAILASILWSATRKKRSLPA